MTLQPFPDNSRPDISTDIALSELAGLLDDSIPPQIKSVLTGLLTDGLIGGMDAMVFNNILSVPPQLQSVVEGLYSGLKNKESLSSLGTNALLNFVEGGDLNVLKDVTNLAMNISSPLSLLNGLSSTTSLLQQFGTIADFAIPGYNVVKTASTVMSALGLSGDLGIFSGQGLGLDSMVEALGSPANVVTNLVAPSVSKLFGGVFGGGSDPRNQCPCLEICRKTDHFITEKNVNLLRTCAPVMNGSVAASNIIAGGLI